MQNQKKKKKELGFKREFYKKNETLVLYHLHSLFQIIGNKENYINVSLELSRTSYLITLSYSANIYRYDRFYVLLELETP